MALQPVRSSYCSPGAFYNVSFAPPFMTRPVAVFSRFRYILFASYIIPPLCFTK